MITRWRRIAIALLAGLIAFLLALYLCGFVTVPKLGYRVDISTLPNDAREILYESPGVPLNQEQWSRLNKVMARHGGWSSGPNIFIKSVKTSWYWLFIIPGIAAFLLRGFFKTLKPLEIFLIMAPSVIGLILIIFLGK